LVECLPNGQSVGEGGERTGPPARYGIRPAAASSDLGRGVICGAINGGPIEITGETNLRPEHAREQMISLDTRGGCAPIDGSAVQSAYGRHASGSTNMIRQRPGTGHKRIGPLS